MSSPGGILTTDTMKSDVLSLPSAANLRRSFRLFTVRLFDLGYLFYKCFTSFLRLPYYFFKNKDRFIFDYLKVVVDRTLNLEIVYDHKIQSVDLRGLRAMLRGPEPTLKVLFENQYGNINFHEGVVISYLIQTLQPRCLFEIGTFDGFSTYHLAMNSPEDAKIYTLNLPPTSSFEDYHELYSLTEYRGDYLTHELGKSLGIGKLYRESEARHKVTQLFGDSLNYDFTDLKGKVDFCFVDGGHSYRHVKSDTLNVMDILSPNGVIVWHDYNIQHRDIFRFLNELSSEVSLYHVIDTRLVIFFKNPAKVIGW